MMSDPAPHRSGFLAGGNFIVDAVKLIDAWPDQDTLCSILETRRSNGGGPYNILKNLARLSPDLPREACGLIGNDEEGSWLLDDCRQAGIDTTQLRPEPGQATSFTDAMTVTDTGRRTFFHQSGANAHLAERHFDFSQTTAKVFFLGYLMLLDTLDQLDDSGHTGASRVLRAARDAGLIAAVDCVSTPHPQFREIALASLREADVFFLNEIEAGWILHHDVTPARAAESLRELAALGARGHIVLHFAEGAMVLAANDGALFAQGAVQLPADRIVGASGAGDAFATGFLYGIHEGWSVEDALRCAVCVAAQSLSSSTPSDGLVPLEVCLALGETYGYQAPPT